MKSTCANFYKLVLSLSLILAVSIPASAGDDRTNQYLGIYPVFIFWAGNDQCSYEFVLDGTGGDSGEEMRDVTVSMTGASEAGKSLGVLSFHVTSIGGSDANRYTHASAAGQCGIHSLIINKATGKISGKPVDLIGEDVISVSRTLDPPTVAIDSVAAPGKQQSVQPPAPPPAATVSTPAKTAVLPPGQTDNGSSFKSKLKGLLGIASLLPCNSPDLRNQFEEAVEKDLYQRNLLTRDVENSIYEAAGSLHEVTSPKAREIASHYNNDLSKVLVCEGRLTSILGQQTVVGMVEFINPNTKKIGAEVSGYLNDADTTFGSVEGLHDEP